MRRLVTLFLVTLIAVASVSAERRVLYSWYTEAKWAAITAALEEVDDTLQEEIAIEKETANDDEKAALDEALAAYDDFKAAIAWAEDRFRPRGGHKYTLRPKESKEFEEMLKSAYDRFQRAEAAYSVAVELY